MQTSKKGVRASKDGFSVTDSAKSSENFSQQEFEAFFYETNMEVSSERKNLCQVVFFHQIKRTFELTVYSDQEAWCENIKLIQNLQAKQREAYRAFDAIGGKFAILF